jgi:hypothetical protein
MPSFDAFSSLIKLVNFIRDELATQFYGVSYDTVPVEEIESKTNEVILYTKDTVAKAFEMGLVPSELEHEIDEGIVFTLAGGHLTDRHRDLDIAELMGGVECV